MDKRGYLRWTISWHPHAAGNDRGNPRDAGELYACQITKPSKTALRNQGGFVISVVIKSKEEE